MEHGLKICDWPIRFLQDNLYGIFRGDLIMLAASTGVGKSTISRIITRQAISQGQPVVLYSLEDECGTFAKKSVYRLYAERAFEPLPYRLFKNAFQDSTKFVEERKAALEQIRMKTEDGLRMLEVHEMRTPQWTIQEVIEQMRAEAALGYKFFILDHFDVIVEDSPTAQRNAMNELWRFVDETKIALLTFSQLSTGRNKESLCPGIDDLRGSKAKVHTPTIVLSLAKHLYNYYSECKGCPTYCRILKDRDGGRIKCGVIFYDNESYLQDYRDVECNDSGTRIDGETHATLSKMK